MMQSKGVILLLIGCFFRNSSAVTTLTANIDVVDNSVTVCPGDFISITCTHNNPFGATRWNVIENNVTSCSTVVFLVPDDRDTSCGVFSITMIHSSSGPIFSSTAQTTATESLNGTRVECVDSSDSGTSTLTISVLAIPTPTISSVEKVFQSLVKVNMSLTDSQCVDSYQVEAFQIGGSGYSSKSSPSSIVDVSGLDVCQYNYSFVGSVFTAGGVQSELSSPVRFSANLSAAVATLTTNGNDSLRVCPKDCVSITCSHTNDFGATRWNIFPKDSTSCVSFVSHHSPSDTTCGVFNITVISDATGPTFSSTAQTTATDSLNGTQLECSESSDDFGILTVFVLGIPTPTITFIEQVSRSKVRVSLSVADSPCEVLDPDSYQVVTTPVRGNGSASIITSKSPTSTVDINGLDLCQYNYSFVGSIFTADGVQSEPSSPVSFSADPSAISTPTISSVEAISQFVVRVNLSVVDLQCPALGLSNYQVKAIPVGGNGSARIIASSSISSVDVGGLDVCQYRYRFVGSFFTAAGVQSEQSSPVSFFAAISTLIISSVEPISQFVVRVNLSVAESRCPALGLHSYHVEATPAGVNISNNYINASSATSIVDVSGLDVCRYNYSFVGLVFAADGVHSDLSSPMSFSIDLSGLHGITVTINQVDPLIEWEQMGNPLYPTCITEYFIDGGAALDVNITVNSTTRSLTAQQLIAAGFPNCISIHPTVTPITPMGPLTSASGNKSVMLIGPDFPGPLLFPRFSFIQGEVKLQVSTQSIPETLALTRSYQYTTNGTTFPMMSFNSSYFRIELTGAEAGQEIMVNVTFQNGLCTSMSSATYNVPSRIITGLSQGQSTDTSHNITITLPLTEYQPEQLLILSTASAPEEDVIVLTNYSSPGTQNTVVFTGLSQDTAYNFTIRIILHSNHTVDVVPPVSGMFMTIKTSIIETAATMSTTTLAEEPSSQFTGCGTVCIALVTVAAFLIIFVIAAAVFLGMCTSMFNM